MLWCQPVLWCLVRSSQYVQILSVYPSIHISIQPIYHETDADADVNDADADVADTSAGAGADVDAEDATAADDDADIADVNATTHVGAHPRTKC